MNVTSLSMVCSDFGIQITVIDTRVLYPARLCRLDTRNGFCAGIRCRLAGCHEILKQTYKMKVAVK